MGIFGMIQKKKKELKDYRIQQRKEQYENDMLELKQLRTQKKKLQAIKELNDDLKKERKTVKQLKHPILSKVAKNLRNNLKKQANKKKEGNVFMQSSGPNPIFHSSGNSENIFTQGMNKKRRK